MHAKIENGQVVSYPYRHLNLKRDNPAVSFPRNALDEVGTQEKYGIVRVEEVSVPEDNRFVYTEGTPVFDGSVWKQLWNQVEKSTEEIQGEANKVVIRKRETQYGEARDQIEFITEKGLEEWQLHVAQIKSDLPIPYPDAYPFTEEMRDDEATPPFANIRHW